MSQVQLKVPGPDPGIASALDPSRDPDDVPGTDAEHASGRTQLLKPRCECPEHKLLGHSANRLAIHRLGKFQHQGFQVWTPVKYFNFSRHTSNLPEPTDCAFHTSSATRSLKQLTFIAVRRHRFDRYPANAYIMTPAMASP